jgi:hypothetical protein
MNSTGDLKIRKAHTAATLEVEGKPKMKSEGLD